MTEMQRTRDLPLTERIAKHVDTNSDGYRFKVEHWEETRKAREMAEVAEINATFARKRMERIIQKTRSMTFDNYLCREQWQVSAKKIALDYARHPDTWFYYGGQSGCGKTHLCMAICRELAQRGSLVTFCRWREEVRTLSDRSFTTAEDRKRRLWKLKESETLFIDDFLKGQTGAQEKQIAFEILDDRYQSGKRTIISSEWLIDKVTEEFDEAVGGRIIEMCKGNIITLPHNNRRNFRTENLDQAERCTGKEETNGSNQER